MDDRRGFVEKPAIDFRQFEQTLDVITLTESRCQDKHTFVGWITQFLEKRRFSVILDQAFERTSSVIGREYGSKPRTFSSTMRKAF